MIELAKDLTGEPVPLSRVAEHQDLSRKYLQQLMAELRRAGLVRVVKGFKGGFLLCRPAEEIKIGDIIRALEGDLGLVECVHHVEMCQRSTECLTRDLWVGATDALEQYFDSITLADIINRNIGNLAS
jgi:Rrf2 family protein